MAVLKTIEADGDAWALWGANISDRCFLCGEQMSLPAVYWANGNIDRKDDVQIWMHPKCARQLGQNLMRDADRAVMEKQR